MKFSSSVELQNLKRNTHLARLKSTFTMKLCLIFLSATFLGTMAAKLPQNDQNKPGPKDDRWRKLNSGPVCFGARGNQFGKFYIPLRGGSVGAIKLVYMYGYVSCDTRYPIHWSYWGCAHHEGVKQRVSVAITTSGNHVLLPASQLASGPGLWTTIPGYNSQSPELVLSFYSHPRPMTPGEELRLWYGEDLASFTEGDNGGRVCCDVYGLFI